MIVARPERLSCGTRFRLNQEWDGDATAVAATFQIGPDDKVSIKCKLLAVKEADGRQVADVAVTGHVVKIEGGQVETTITLGGVSRFDLLTGETDHRRYARQPSVCNVAESPGLFRLAFTIQADGEIQHASGHQRWRPLRPIGVAGPPVGPGTVPHLSQ